jgi:hypothetical protein
MVSYACQAAFREHVAHATRTLPFPWGESSRNGTTFDEIATSVSWISQQLTAVVVGLYVIDGAGKAICVAHVRTPRPTLRSQSRRLTC